MTTMSLRNTNLIDYNSCQQPHRRETLETKINNGQFDLTLDTKQDTDRSSQKSKINLLKISKSINNVCKTSK